MFEIILFVLATVQTLLMSSTAVTVDTVQIRAILLTYLISRHTGSTQIGCMSQYLWGDTQTIFCFQASLESEKI